MTSGIYWDRETPQYAARFDPLTQPVAITGQCVIGDQLRVPAAWCAMAGCDASFADATALGEADNRARAVESGWAKDALGRLVCPACQHDRPVPVWWLPPQVPSAAGGQRPVSPVPRPAGGTNEPLRAAAPGPRPAAAAGRAPAAARGRHQRAQWPRLLSGRVK